MKSLKHKARHYKVNKTNKMKKHLDTQLRVKDLCMRSGFNTFEGKLFKNAHNKEEVDKILKEYRNYTDNLKKVISDAYLVKEHSNQDFYSYINDDWIHKQEEKLKKELKYYAQVDSFRIAQEKVYYQVIDYVNDYIKTNPHSKKAKLLDNVYKAIYNTTKTVGLKHTHKVKEDVERFIEKKICMGY